MPLSSLYFLDVYAVTTVLALATLGNMTQLGLFLFFAAPPKVAKANTSVSLTDLYIGLWSHCVPTFANVNTALLLGSHKDHSMHIERANMHCQGNAHDRSFNMAEHQLKAKS